MPDRVTGDVGSETTSIDVTNTKVKMSLPAIASVVGTIIVILVSLGGGLWGVARAVSMGERGLITSESTNRILLGDAETGAAGMLEVVRKNTADISKVMHLDAQVDDIERRLSKIEATRFTKDDAQQLQASLANAFNDLKTEFVKQTASIEATQKQILRQLEAR